MVSKTISPDCGVRASLMLFYCTTIAYRLGLSAISGDRRQCGQLRKNEFIMADLYVCWQHQLPQGDVDSDVVYRLKVLDRCSISLTPGTACQCPQLQAWALPQLLRNKNSGLRGLLPFTLSISPLKRP